MLGGDGLKQLGTFFIEIQKHRRLSSGALPLREYELCILEVAAREPGRNECFSGGSRFKISQLKLKHRRGADSGDRGVHIRNARQLNQQAVLGVPCNRTSLLELYHRLSHPEEIHSPINDVAERVECSLRIARDARGICPVYKLGSAGQIKAKLHPVLAVRSVCGEDEPGEEACRNQNEEGRKNARQHCFHEG